ncbi:UMP-CMP kinase [Hysterangium stoloniferum]|nr:UMP-CMP kinase [Hysterangium stoloniferum]
MVNSTSHKCTVFDDHKVIVIYVLGGPGAGKGTQCARLVKDYDFVHLSAGDLLRAEQNRDGSLYGEMIRTCIREGNIVPMEVTVKLLENAMHDALESNINRDAWTDGKGRFLIDGFPRKMDQALKFDEEVCMASLVLFFSCTEEVMLGRLLERSKTSGREDDNIDTIKKRFGESLYYASPVIEYYRTLHRVAEIDSTLSIDEVYGEASKTIHAIFNK